MTQTIPRTVDELMEIIAKRTQSNPIISADTLISSELLTDSVIEKTDNCNCKENDEDLLPVIPSQLTNRLPVDKIELIESTKLIEPAESTIYEVAEKNEDNYVNSFAKLGDQFVSALSENQLLESQTKNLTDEIQRLTQANSLLTEKIESITQALNENENKNIINNDVFFAIVGLITNSKFLIEPRFNKLPVPSRDSNEYKEYALTAHLLGLGNSELGSDFAKEVAECQIIANY
jgi:hypothetical protein